jgi:acetyl-CoA carboxylase carboxyltransferase component
VAAPLIPAPAAAPLASHRSDAVAAAVGELDGRTVSWFRLDGGKHRGAIGVAEGEALERAVIMGVELGVPVVGVVATSGADVTEGVAALHAWGRVAQALSQASGVVPVLLASVGPCISGPALLLGLADQVVMTSDSFAYLSGPDTVEAFTGVATPRSALGSATLHGTGSGLAALVVDDEDAAMHALCALLEYLPSNNTDDPPRMICDDPIERDCRRAVAAVPDRASASYDVRDVLTDVFDDESFLELRPGHGPNLVTGLGRVGGRPVGVLANQPRTRAGTIDIDASRKGARFVQWCDAFNVPLVTFVDTPGFEPGRDLEWRGMIRHGAQLVHAYAQASVPRLCVVLRKAYGGAYIVMDSKRLGNDWCAAWPSAEIAVMGPDAAVEVLHRKTHAAIDDESERLAQRDNLVREYEDRFENPYVAAERGYVDTVIEPIDTRRALDAALRRLATKRETLALRLGRHSNTPL